ncbi:MAG: hypothetical protein JEZ14_25825 [Marinilabiliaceae bacterium]|nr:hypothetical protein [Marinilabiliaceae bacterium]
METTIMDSSHLQKQLEAVEKQRQTLRAETKTATLPRLIEIEHELSALTIKKQSLEKRIKSSSLPKTKIWRSEVAI